MPDPVDPSLTPIQTDDQTYSPSPTPGQPPPKRRETDTKSYAFQWTALFAGLTFWAIGFLNEIAKLPWDRIRNHEFIFEHAAQILGVIAGVVFAKQIPNRP